MPIYSEYLDTLKGNFEALSAERKKQLARISKLRQRDTFVFASAIGKGAVSSIDYSDLIPIADQLEGLKSDRIDIILETPGGSGETTEDIVRLLRNNRKEVNFIVPGCAKSAGTIMVTSGDDILMGSVSTLGPIDAQVQRDGKFFSAEAFLEGLKKIKKETDELKYLNRAYIPILQMISPGEIEAASNALKFGKKLAADWLNKYKFAHWTNHSDGRPVTPEERMARALEVSEDLGKHSEWLSHGRSITLQDLERMGVKVTNYEKEAELNDAIRRYHVLMRMSFETNIYKLYETPTSQILRFQGGQQAPQQQALHGEIDWPCPKCKTVQKIQFNFQAGVPLKQGCIPFPADNKFTCPNCKTQSDLSPIRLQLEAQAKKKIL